MINRPGKTIRLFLACWMAWVSLSAVSQPAAVTGNEIFSYLPSPEYQGVQIVTPVDGSVEGVLVSDSYLKMLLNDPRLSNEQRWQTLRAFPQKMEQSYESAITRNYPTASSSAPENAFKDTVLEGKQHNIVLTQDNQARPYVRVTVTTKNNKVLEEFSLSAEMVNQILNSDYRTSAQKVDYLRMFPFRLPDRARERFPEMTSETIRTIAEEDLPNLKRQEMVKMHQIYEKERARKEDAQDSEAKTPAPVAADAEKALAATPQPVTNAWHNDEVVSSTPTALAPRAALSAPGSVKRLRRKRVHSDEVQKQDTQAAQVEATPSGTGASTRNAMVVLTVLAGVVVAGIGYRIYFHQNARSSR